MDYVRAALQPLSNELMDQALINLMEKGFVKSQDDGNATIPGSTNEMMNGNNSNNNSGGNMMINALPNSSISVP